MGTKIEISLKCKQKGSPVLSLIQVFNAVIALTCVRLSGSSH